MRIRYSQWTPQSMTDEQRLQSLTSLFSYLLVKTSGDVNEALEWLREVAKQYGLFDENMTLDDLIEKLKEMGIIEEAKDMFVLTTKGVQRIRQDALREIFTSLKKAPSGSHETPYTGKGVDRLSETKKWSFGDQPTDLDLTSTLTNSFKRDGIDDFSLKEEDLEVYETEHMTTCATVLMVDISHSMILYGEDRITPAKQVALALSELISTKFPKDYLSLVVFGDDAKVVSMSELPFLNVGPYHTNTRAGLQLARSLLRRRGNVNKQIFMVTDGKPSAIFDDAGRLYKNSFGLDPRIVNKTLDEAVQCRREKIVVSTFMVAQDPYLINYVEDFTKANQGRAYYSSLNNLGKFIFVDYLRNRRKRMNSRQ
ncbi:MAG: VWA domain-containing protein [Ignavibacteriae bacterium]|nr:VWA domain-containing protein [Ignavibacteriota bacterium]